MQPEKSSDSGTSGELKVNPTGAVPMGNTAAAPDFSLLVSTIEAQQAELVRLRERLLLRDQALDAASSHFTIMRHTDTGSIIEYCNQALLQHLGYAEDEVLYKELATIFPRDWSAERYAECRSAIMAGERVQIEEQFSRKDGSLFWCGMTIVPIRRDASGYVTHSMSMAADISARRAASKHEKELQEQLVSEMKKRELILLELRVAQKLEAVGRLAAGVAHEINTPIQYVGDSLHFLRSAFTDILQMFEECGVAMESGEVTAVSDLRTLITAAAERIDLKFIEAEIPKAFDRTFEGVERVASIVRAMKEFSHPDAGEFSPGDINHAVQNTLIVATNEYKYICRVKTELDPNIPAINCNIGELNQVFLNLIVNAAHAVQDSGKDIHSGEISISTSLAGEYLEIMIADNGCGIPAEHLEKIYDPFFTTKEVGRGTGQGLAITRSIVVDKHGGTLQVYSEVGEGTQFIISLPVAGRSREAVS